MNYKWVQLHLLTHKRLFLLPVDDRLIFKTLFLLGTNAEMFIFLTMLKPKLKDLIQTNKLSNLTRSLTES